MASNSPKLPGLQTPLEPEEPIFILRARDSLAPHMVALWAAMAAGDTSSAIAIFADMDADAGYKYRNQPRETEKINSASDISIEMNSWRARHNLEHFGIHTVHK